MTDTNSVNDILNGIEMNDKLRWPPLQMNIVNVESALKERYGGRVTFSDFRDVKELYDDRVGSVQG